MLKKILFLVYIILVSIALEAEVYYLNDLINHGLTSSTNIMRSQNAIQNSRDNRMSAYLDLLPTANITASYVDPDGLGDYSSSFSISKYLSLNEPTYFNLRRTALDRRIVELSHENRRKEIARDILFSYINIIQQERSIRIIEENLNQQRRMFEQTKIQFESGRRTIFEVQNIQLDTLDTYIQLVDLHNSLDSQRENLFLILNLEDKGYPFEIIDFEILPVPNISEPRNLNIEISELGLEMNRNNLTQQYLGQLPNISVGYSWSTNAVNRWSSNWYGSYNIGTFMINFSYPIFNHGSNIGYRISKRSFNLENQVFEEEKERFSLEITQIINDLNRLIQTYELHQQRLELTRTNLRMAEERYMLGVLSNLELIETRNSYLNAEFQLINQFYSIIRRQEELNFALSGKILGIW
ncbi:MAG: TolC family protein [Candidatus Cloacimonetes bacterium]|nr:TolC family protein [Candidatus Cloacimonadota bacterium]